MGKDLSNEKYDTKTEAGLSLDWEPNTAETETDGDDSVEIEIRSELWFWV